MAGDPGVTQRYRIILAGGTYMPQPAKPKPPSIPSVNTWASQNPAVFRFYKVLHYASVAFVGAVSKPSYFGMRWASEHPVAIARFDSYSVPGFALGSAPASAATGNPVSYESSGVVKQHTVVG